MSVNEQELSHLDHVLRDARPYLCYSLWFQLDHMEGINIQENRTHDSKKASSTPVCGNTSKQSNFVRGTGE